MKQICETCHGYGKIQSYAEYTGCRDCNGTGLEEDYDDTGWGPIEWREEAQMRATGPLSQYPLRKP